MDKISRPFNGKNYWRKKGYNLLDGALQTKRNIQVVTIKGGDPIDPTIRKRRFWRLKKSPKLHLKKVSSLPKKLWKKFKNGYINMMLKMAGDVGKINGGSEFERKRITQAREVEVNYKNIDEFKARIVLEIYKALITSRGLSEVV